MSWNYRILNHGGCFALHEVYYDDEGVAYSWTHEPTQFECGLDEGPEGIIKSLEMALADAKALPVLRVPQPACAGCDAAGRCTYACEYSAQGMSAGTAETRSGSGPKDRQPGSRSECAQTQDTSNG